MLKLAVLEEGNCAPSEPNLFLQRVAGPAFEGIRCPSRRTTHQLQASVRSPSTVVTQQRDVDMQTLKLHRYVVAMQCKMR